MSCRVSDLMRRDDLCRQINLESYTGEEYGLPTLQDIMVELVGIVTNMTNFGAFVDIGVH